MSTQLYLVMLVLFPLALAWKVQQMCRAREDRGLQVVVLILSCLFLAFLLSLPRVAVLTRTLLFPGAPKLLQTGLAAVSLYLLLCFLTDRRDTGSFRRFVGWNAAVTAAGIVTMSVEMVGAVPAHRALYYALVPDDGWLVAFYVTGELLLGYLMAAGAVFAVRTARLAGTRAARGLRMMSAGLAGSLLGAPVIRLIEIVHQRSGAEAWDGFDALGDALVGASALVLLAGVVYPGAAARVAQMRFWLAARSRYHQLEPLWTLLRDAFPDNILDPGDHRHPLGLHGVHRRYVRRWAECRDGLLALRPFLPPPAHQPENPAAQADRVRTALERHRRHERAPGGPATLDGTVRGDEDMETDVRRLLALSGALTAAAGGR